MSLLDDRKGGRFALAPFTPATTTKQVYMPDTASFYSMDGAIVG